MRDQTRKRYDLESLWSKTFSEMKKQGSAAEIMSESA
jgi:ribosomal silencing factor RsfS